MSKNCVFSGRKNCLKSEPTVGLQQLVFQEFGFQALAVQRFTAPKFDNKFKRLKPHCMLRCKFGQLGHGIAQLNTPHGFCIGRNQEIVIADTYNNRIQVNFIQNNFSFFPSLFSSHTLTPLLRGLHLYQVKSLLTWP